VSENLKERNHSEDLGVHWKTVEWIFPKRVGGCGMDASGLGWGRKGRPL